MLNTLPKTIIDFFLAYGSLNKFPKNHQLFADGESGSQIFLIVDGHIALSKETASGKELTLRIATKNNLIGENILFSTITTYTTTAKTTELTTVLSLAKSKLEGLIQNDSETLVSCLKLLQVQSMREQSKLRDLLLHGKKGALFSTLIRLSNTYGEKVNDGLLIQKKLTNTELANLCGTSREVVNRLLQQLKKEAIISENNGLITVHNVSYLKVFCECDSCPLVICQIN